MCVVWNLWAIGLSMTWESVDYLVQGPQFSEEEGKAKQVERLGLHGVVEKAGKSNITAALPQGGGIAKSDCIARGISSLS